MVDCSMRYSVLLIGYIPIYIRTLGTLFEPMVTVVCWQVYLHLHSSFRTACLI